MSFIKLHYTVVRQRCERTIASIEEKRRECERQYVLCKLENTNDFRRFFRLKPKTFEEVYEKVKRDWNYPSLYALRNYDAAKRLLNAANIVNADEPFVYVNSEDIKLIWFL